MPILKISLTINQFDIYASPTPKTLVLVLLRGLHLIDVTGA
jgi:hypothetical protein